MCVRLLHIFKPEAGNLAAEEAKGKTTEKDCYLYPLATCVIIYYDGKWGYSHSVSSCLQTSYNIKYEKDLSYIWVAKQTKEEVSYIHISNLRNLIIGHIFLFLFQSLCKFLTG